jgi:hypothetical protein
MNAKLRPNPFSHVTIRRLAGEPAELRVWSATKSRGATTRNIAKGGRADFDRVCKIAGLAGAPRGAAFAPSIEDYVVLAALGLWAPEDDLIDPVLLEASIRSNASAKPPAGNFALRGEAWLQNGSEPCGPVSDLPLGCLSASRPILWHKGSELEPVWPWWPDAACLAAIEAVQRDAPLHPDMLPALQALADQGILMRRPAKPVAPSNSRLDSQASRHLFVRDGFLNLGQVLPPGQVAAFRDYWRRLAALNLFPQRGDNRHGSHGEPSSILLLHLLKPLIEYIVGAPLEAAFSYSWFYRRGTEMARHRDRAESRYTVTLLIDYAPAVDGPTPWPLFIWPRGQDSPVEIRQSIGDALLFCGEDLRHSRPPFTMGERSTSLLLHYVDKGFPGKLF